MNLFIFQHHLWKNIKYIKQWEVYHVGIDFVDEPPLILLRHPSKQLWMQDLPGGWSSCYQSKQVTTQS